jgi:hypothetical protein
MRRPALILLAALALLGGCRSQRPTEFSNITFTPSVDTDDYATWDFDLGACRGFDDPQVDDAFIRGHLLRAIEEQLAQRGYERRTTGTVDFTVFYELDLADGGDVPGLAARARARIFLRDVATGRLVWRGERKAPATGEATHEELVERIDRFARELLKHTRKLEQPEEQG